MRWVRASVRVAECVEWWCGLHWRKFLCCFNFLSGRNHPANSFRTEYFIFIFSVGIFTLVNAITQSPYTTANERLLFYFIFISHFFLLAVMNSTSSLRLSLPLRHATFSFCFIPFCRMKSRVFAPGQVHLNIASFIPKMFTFNCCCERIYEWMVRVRATYQVAMRANEQIQSIIFIACAINVIRYDSLFVLIIIIMHNKNNDTLARSDSNNNIRNLSTGG